MRSSKSSNVHRWALLCESEISLATAEADIVRTFCISSQDYIICCNGETTRHSRCLVGSAADQAKQEHSNISSTFNFLAILKKHLIPLSVSRWVYLKARTWRFQAIMEWWNWDIVHYERHLTTLSDIEVCCGWAYGLFPNTGEPRESRADFIKMLMQVVLRRTRLSKTLDRAFPESLGLYCHPIFEHY